MSRELRMRLKNELRADFEPCGEHMEQTIKLARSAYARRRRLRNISSFEMMAGQLRFIVRPVWFLQGIVLICLCALMSAVMKSEEFSDELPAFLSASSVLIAMTALPIYGRSRRYRMYEIESSTRISNKRLMLTKLCVVGLGDVICLGAIAALALGKMTLPAQMVLTLILLPFLLSCTGSLFVLNRAREEYGVYISAGLCIGIAGACRAAAARLLPVSEQISIGLVAAVCAVMIILLAFECRRLMGEIPSSDLREALMF